MPQSPILDYIDELQAREAHSARNDSPVQEDVEDGDWEGLDPSDEDLYDDDF